MAEKRRLPVLNNPGPPPPPSEGDAAAQEPPPWHWIPLGALISIAVGAVLARSFYVPFMQRQIDRVYGRHATAAEYARIDATLSQATRDALQLRLALAGAAIALLAVLIGGFVVGRFGARTNQRHGTLAGITTMVILMLYLSTNTGLGGFLGSIALVPFGGLAGWLGALLGYRLRLRAEA